MAQRGALIEAFSAMLPDGSVIASALRTDCGNSNAPSPSGSELSGFFGLSFGVVEFQIKSHLFKFVIVCNSFSNICNKII